MMEKSKPIECIKCGKLIPIEELSEHSKLHSLGIIPTEETAEINHSDPDIYGLIGHHERRKTDSTYPSIFFGIVLVGLGLSFWLGIVQNWPIVLIAFGIAYLIKPLFSKSK